MMKFSRSTLSASILAASMLALAACGGGSSDSPQQETPKQETPKQEQPSTAQKPDTYTFESKFDAGKSAVSYTGQTARLALIDDMSTQVKTTSDVAKAGKYKADDLTGAMKFFIDGPTEAGEYVLSKISGKVTSPQTLIPGPTYGDISTGKKLANKVAGEDKDAHLVDGKMVGWNGITKPLDMINELVKLAEKQATETANGNNTLDPNGNQIDVTYVDGEGRDLYQLVNKFLLTSVTFSQGTADYLKTDFLSKNKQAEGKPYTEAEHKWDEAFGYFGASRDYGKLSDDDIKGKLISDADANNEIDLRSEVNQGAAVNCAKRDAGSTVKTDYTKTAFDAFVEGRYILNNAAGAQFAEGDDAKLKAAALQASQAWEKCIAATVVHYINDTHADLQDAVDNGGKFKDLDAYKKLAKHWSEMKGFALGLQFNPDSPFHSSAANKAKFSSLHSLMGQAPVIKGTADITQYQKDLLSARDIMQAAYGFDAENVKNW